MAGLNYSRLNNTVTKYESAGWNDLQLSNITIARRNQLKHSIDDFTGFTWRGVDAFQAFGAFIINNKNTLKFYNGPAYSNEYTKPMFESAAGQLTGVTFSQQKIDFTIGVYWISEDHYRQLIYWLHPYAVDTLTFDFEDNWYYQVKLASVENGNRYIVGTELINIAEEGQPPFYKKEYMYYTEMKVTFEVQGPNCVYRKEKYEFLSDTQSSNDYIEWQQNTTYTKWESDLSAPLQFSFDLALDQLTQNTMVLSLEVYKNALNSADIYYHRLFNIQLENLPYNSEIENSNSQRISIKYDSETGLLFWQHGDSEYFLLSRLSTLSTGSRFVATKDSEMYQIPGTFDDPNFKLYDLKFRLTWLNKPNNKSISDIILNSDFSIRARSNLI